MHGEEQDKEVSHRARDSAGSQAPSSLHLRAPPSARRREGEAASIASVWLPRAAAEAGAELGLWLVGFRRRRKREERAKRKERERRGGSR